MKMSVDAHGRDGATQPQQNPLPIAILSHDEYIHTAFTVICIEDLAV
jgi:hypothetical protein